MSCINGLAALSWPRRFLMHTRTEIRTGDGEAERMEEVRWQAYLFLAVVPHHGGRWGALRRASLGVSALQNSSALFSKMASLRCGHLFDSASNNVTLYFVSTVKSAASKAAATVRYRLIFALIWSAVSSE